ncbi:TlpA family protein disulfide reductase [Halodesulfurarchaeum sp.]|uniref:TlpA family protein disulfide reductase n=1 Tax=Halodesulfurarchaeum sp. TaxID=1980530 RepID=UPI001BBE8AA9|nr:thioredoxin family protein [Halodesulfurarchaeum sp.]
MAERRVSRRGLLAAGSGLALSGVAGCLSSNETKEAQEPFYGWDEEVTEDVIVYWFWGASCPHCENMMPFMEGLADRKNVGVVGLEVYNNEDNRQRMKEFIDGFGVDQEAVPMTFIGSNYWIGYGDEIVAKIKAKIDECLDEGCRDTRDIVANQD